MTRGSLLLSDGAVAVGAVIVTVVCRGGGVSGVVARLELELLVRNLSNGEQAAE